MKMRTVFLLCVISFCSAWSWGQTPQVDIFLSGGNTLTLPTSGEPQNFTFTASSNWTASSDASWLTLSPTSGTSRYQLNTISVSATPNTVPTECTATITIKGGNSTATVSVRQYSGATLTVSPSSLNFKASGHSQAFTVSISPGSSWTVESSDSWLTVNFSGGASSGNTQTRQITATAAPNTSTAQRTATITVSGTYATTQTISVTQAAAQQGGLLHTWNLSPTMTAVLEIDKGVLTIKTQRDGEGMNGAPWSSVSSAITSVVIEPGVGTIGGFGGCDNLIAVTIPNSVTAIGGDAFYGCSSLVSVTLPNSVRYIRDLAFMNCINLKDVTVSWIIPFDTSIGGGLFGGVETSRVNLHVPAGTENLYRVACSWLEGFQHSHILRKQ